MSYICPICNQCWKDNQKSIQCTSCLSWVHHNNRNNCSGPTNTEFKIHRDDNSKHWECDKCCSVTNLTLPFESDWENFNEIKSN